MAIMARLFMLLAVVIPMLAAACPDHLPEEFPPREPTGNHIHAILQKIRDSCPPFGHYFTDRFSVKVLGTSSPEIGGCAIMVPPHRDIIVPSFNLWLGNSSTGGGRCGEKNMDHYVFECMAKHPYFTEEDTLEGWYVMLYNQTSRFSERQDYKCALYETVNEDPPMIKMVISANQSCKGLSKRMEESEYTVPEGFRHFGDGSVALHFTQEIQVLRKKRSEVQNGGCRFPDWSQGSWTDLKIDGSLVSYEPVVHEKDDVDYGQENDDGKYEDAETTGGEQYMQRSQRHVPVGINGVDHSSSHDSRSHKYRRSIPNNKTVKMIRTQTSTVQNNTLDKDWIKDKLLNDYLSILDLFNFSREGRTVFSDKPTHQLKTSMQFSESGKSFSSLGHGDFTTTTGPQTNPEDLNKKSYHIPFFFDKLRKTKDLNDQHTEKETNNEKKRCYCYTDLEIFTPKNDKNQMELFNKLHRFSQTTKIYPEELIQKSNSPFDFFEFRKKGESGDQDTYVKKNTKLQQKRNNHHRDFEPYIPSDMHKLPLPIFDEYFSTKNKTENLYKILSPFDTVQRKKRDVKHGEEEISNKRKKCYCLNDKTTLKLVDEMITFLATTQKYPVDLKEKSNSPFDFLVPRKKRESGNQHDHGTEGIKHRQKRCFWAKIEIPNMFRGKQFQDNLNIYDSIELSSKPEINFETTQDPTPQNIISEDVNTEGYQDDHKNEEVIKLRQKRSWYWPFTKKPTTTERYRDPQFENPPKMWDPMEPFSKTNKYFGTTPDPSLPNPPPRRKKRSVDDDLNDKYKSTEDDQKTFIKNIKITDDSEELIRGWNIVQDLPIIANHIWEQSKENAAGLNTISNHIPFIYDQLKKTKDLGKQHDHSEKETNSEKRKCYCYHNVEVFKIKNDEDQKELFNKINKYSSTTQKYPDNMNTHFNYLLNAFPRKKRDAEKLLNYDEEKNNNKKKRCFCYNNFEDFVPKNHKSILKLVDEIIKFLPTTQKYPVDLKEKSNSPFDFLVPRKKRESGNQHDLKVRLNDKTTLKLVDEMITFLATTQKYPVDLKEKSNSPFDFLVPRKKRESGNQHDLKVRLNDKTTLKLVDEMITFLATTQKYPVDLKEKSNSPFDFLVPRKKRESGNQHDLKVRLNDKTTLKLVDEMITFLATTQKYPVDLKEKSNSPFDFLVPRKKRESGNQHDHGTEGIEHRQKNSFRAKIEIPNMFRGKQFQDNFNMDDRIELSSKPKINFGATQGPTPRNRKTRSIFDDVNIEDDEEEALKKIKITDQINRRIRWWNIVRAIEFIRHHDILGQSSGDIKDDEYEVFSDFTKIPSSVRYLSFAETHGVPYKQAVLNWRSLEREHRQRIAEVDYTAFPGQNHPDIVMRDFDRTFDGIEYDFNPYYPEGTIDDPTAYRALTLPGGYQIEPRLSRRTMYEQKQSRDTTESTTVIDHIKDAYSNTLNHHTDQLSIPSLNQRTRRSSTQQNQQQHSTTPFTWRCEMAVDNDDKQLPQLENGAKFLTYGGRVVDNNEMTGNDQHNEHESKMSYGCLWLVPRGPNILEFSIIGTGMPSKNESMQTFARQLCSENRVNGKDIGVRNEKKLHPRRPWLVTETRTDDKKRVPVTCPVPPGIVFYGVVPAPPPPSTVSTNKDQVAPLRLCAKLVSSADDCTTGQMGPADQMKYTVSECVEQDSSTGTPQTMVAQQTIFEASRGYTGSGSWRRNKRHSAPTDTSTIASSMETTSTSSNMPILPFSSQNPSIGTIDNITDHQMTGLTATISTPMTPLSVLSSSTGIQPFVDITTIDPTNLTTTVTATTLLTTTPSILPLSSPQETISSKQQLPSLSKLSTSTTIPSTSPSTVTTTSSYQPVTNYHYRQQQQWQQQHQQPNNNNNDYYYRGRQQHYPPPPPGSTGTDNYYYIQQQQQQQWQQQHPQTQPHWLPQQHSITTNDYSNGNQHQTMDTGGQRSGDYYYHQQQQNYHNHQHNNDRQQQTPQPPRNSSLTLQHLNGGSWNVRGDRPLYISSGGGSDNNKNAPVDWNSSTSISSSNNGGWTTAAQQHWWYQQQQQRQQQEQQQRQQHQQQLQQQRQQQNNRGLGGILSLPPVPLPPLHVEQGAVTISMPTPQPLHPRRQLKPPNHYYLPTLTTKTSSQPYRLRSKSESRYYQEREYQCLGQWTEPQMHISSVAGEKPVMLTYTFLKRLSPISKEGPKYECFVGTPIPNDEGLNPATTTTILLTEAGTNTKCSRLSDPYRSGMKLVGTKIKKEGACLGSAQPVQDTTGGSWYSLKPQPISPSIPDAEHGGGAWYAAPPVPVVAQSPTTKMPILTGRHTGGNGATFTSRQNEQTRRPQSANLPPKSNHSIRTVADKRIVILLASLLYMARRFFN